jgi:hypothetical protein
MATNSPQFILPFPALAAESTRIVAESSQPVRGVRWVLAWAAALAVLGWAAAILFAFAYQLAAEQSLTRAATAGLREATCERATRRTVEQTIRRRLTEHGYPDHYVSVALERNGAPVRGVVRPAAGDRLSVSLAVPIVDVLPGWLSSIPALRRDAAITVRVASQASGD